MGPLLNEVRCRLWYFQVVWIDGWGDGGRNYFLKCSLRVGTLMQDLFAKFVLVVFYGLYEGKCS